MSNSVAIGDSKRKLKIKTGALRRIHKELLSYEKEAEKQQSKIESLKAKGAEEHDIKQQEEVLTETLQMIPETTKRLETSVKDLEDFMNSIENDVEAKVLMESDDWKAATEVLADLKRC